VNTGHCPETSKDANGYNRYYRIKVLLNVAEKWLSSTLCSAKAQRVGKVDDSNFCCRLRPSFRMLEKVSFILSEKVFPKY